QRLVQQQEPWERSHGPSQCHALRFTARKSARTAWQERRNFQHIDDPLHERFGIVTPDTESNVSLDRHMRKERFSLRNVTHLPVTWTDVRTGSHVVDRGMVDDDSPGRGTPNSGDQLQHSCLPRTRGPEDAGCPSLRFEAHVQLEMSERQANALQRKNHRAGPLRITASLIQRAAKAMTAQIATSR